MQHGFDTFTHKVELRESLRDVDDCGLFIESIVSPGFVMEKLLQNGVLHFSNVNSVSRKSMLYEFINDVGIYNFVNLLSMTNREVARALQYWKPQWNAFISFQLIREMLDSRDSERVLSYFIQFINVIVNIEDDLRDEIYTISIKNCSNIYCYIPIQHRSTSLIATAIQTHGGAFMLTVIDTFIDSSGDVDTSSNISKDGDATNTLLTEEICMLIVRNNPMSIADIPGTLMSIAVRLEAIRASTDKRMQHNVKNLILNVHPQLLKDIEKYC